MRKICAKTATSTKQTTRLPRLDVRSTARPFQSSRSVLTARWRSPALTGASTAIAMTGAHHGSPSGAISVNDASAASDASTARIGNSAAISVGTCGATSGDERRSAPIRMATPRLPLMTLPSTCMLEARKRTRRATVPPAASIVRCHASERDSSATICSSTVAASTDALTPRSASTNSWRLPASA